MLLWVYARNQCLLLLDQPIRHCCTIYGTHCSHHRHRSSRSSCSWITSAIRHKRWCGNRLCAYLNANFMARSCPRYHVKVSPSDQRLRPDKNSCDCLQHVLKYLRTVSDRKKHHVCYPRVAIEFRLSTTCYEKWSIRKVGENKGCLGAEGGREGGVLQAVNSSLTSPLQSMAKSTQHRRDIFLIFLSRC